MEAMISEEALGLQLSAISYFESLRDAGLIDPSIPRGDKSLRGVAKLQGDSGSDIKSINSP